MVIVLIHNPQTGQHAIHIENGSAELALGTLNAAIREIRQQMSAPKVFLPNGQAKVVAPKDGDNAEPTQHEGNE